VRGDASNSNTNYGTANLIRTRSSESAEGLFRFDISEVPGYLVAATLRLVTSASDGGMMNVHELADNGWSETGVTYSTRPAPYGEIIGQIQAPIAASGTVMELDVTDYVSAHLEAGLISFATTGTGSLVRVHSRESSNAANHPRLIIVYSLDDPNPINAFESWLNDSGLTGPEADPGAIPHGDGVPNLLKYALGGSAHAPGTHVLPALQVGEPGAAGATVLTFTFSRISDPALTYEVWASEDLIDWGSSPIWTSTGNENTAGSITVTDPAPMGENTRRFLKLRVRHSLP
jgi:hypothetical protein